MVRWYLCMILGLAGTAAEPCRSGPQPQQRPGPYSSLFAVGPQRGQQHCFVCETATRPAIIVFARSLSAPLGKLVKGIDTAVNQHKKAELRAWVTFLGEDQPSLDPQVVQWGKQYAIGAVPLSVFQDAVGPPSYLLSRDADVTVLLSVRQKVVANFAFRAGELNDEAIAAVLRAVPRIASEKK
jgi:hypothetical protein